MRSLIDTQRKYKGRLPSPSLLQLFNGNSISVTAFFCYIFQKFCIQFFFIKNFLSIASIIFYFCHFCFFFLSASASSSDIYFLLMPFGEKKLLVVKQTRNTISYIIVSSHSPQLAKHFFFPTETFKCSALVS